jgi:hypothetical protein
MQKVEPQLALPGRKNGRHTQKIFRIHKDIIKENFPKAAR